MPLLRVDLPRSVRNKRFMRTFILSSAALLALAGCGQSATTNATAPNTAQANTVEPDITEVPDESADANGAAQDVDDANETDSGADNGTANGAAAR
jgi:ABC-type glycerol-3-phosphate transport system substrate-binding protein